MKKLLTILFSLSFTSVSWGAVVIQTDRGAVTNSTIENTAISGSDFSSTIGNASTEVATGTSSSPAAGTIPAFTFYGSTSMTGDGTTATPTDVLQSYTRIFNNNSFHRFGATINDANVPASETYYAFVWEQANWQALTTGEVTVDATSSIIYDTANVVGSFGNDYAFVLQNGSSFYYTTPVSQTVIDDGLTNLAAVEWFLFDPTANNFGFSNVSDYRTPSGGVLGSTLTNIVGVGGLVYSANASGTSANSFFSAELVAVPEPSTFVMLFMSMGLLFLFRRRQA